MEERDEESYRQFQYQLVHYLKAATIFVMSPVWFLISSLINLPRSAEKLAAHTRKFGVWGSLNRAFSQESRWVQEQAAFIFYFSMQIVTGYGDIALRMTVSALQTVVASALRVFGQIILLLHRVIDLIPLVVSRLLFRRASPGHQNRCACIPTARPAETVAQSGEKVE